jgi:hypothetical protein
MQFELEPIDRIWWSGLGGFDVKMAVQGCMETILAIWASDGWFGAFLTGCWIGLAAFVFGRLFTISRLGLGQS